MWSELESVCGLKWNVCVWFEVECVCGLKWNVRGTCEMFVGHVEYVHPVGPVAVLLLIRG